MEHEQREGQSTERELDVVERRVRHMRRLVADLLDVSRVTRGKIQLQKRPLELMAVTGYGQSSDRQRSREAGFDAHLVKPVELEAVRTMVVGGASCQGAAFLAKSKNVRTG